jgi:hypothetical protein
MKNRHHVYPKRYRQYGTQTKIVDARKHNAFHQIVEDKDPVNALCYIILHFMPDEMRPLMNEVKKYGEKTLPNYLQTIFYICPT